LLSDVIVLQWVAVSALAVMAVGWDLRTRRVPNVLTVGAAVAASVCALAGVGADSLSASMLGWLTGLALFFPLFAVGGLGAGDVKLLAAFGAWLGPEGAFHAALWAALLGGAVAVVVGVARGYLWRALQNLGVALAVWRAIGPSTVPGLTLRDSEGPRLAYAFPIAAGALAALWQM
jgi:prepilin peptidase CpaA